MTQIHRFALLFACTAAPLTAQRYDLATRLTKQQLAVVNRTAVVFDSGGKRGIRLDERSGEGLVWITGAEFTTGTIDIDLRGKDVLQRSFVGIAFHALNDSTYDAAYFRPFNFHAADSVRAIHAVQYVSHPAYPWRRLREERNGTFEKAVPNAPDPNGWFHARFVISASDVRVFVNDNAVPVLAVPKLTTQASGRLGVFVGDGAGGTFANLRVRRSP